MTGQVKLFQCPAGLGHTSQGTDKEKKLPPSLISIYRKKRFSFVPLKNDVILAYFWSIKMYTCLPLVIQSVYWPIIGHLYCMTSFYLSVVDQLQAFIQHLCDCSCRSYRQKLLKGQRQPSHFKWTQILQYVRKVKVERSVLGYYFSRKNKKSYFLKIYIFD